MKHSPLVAFGLLTLFVGVSFADSPADSEGIRFYESKVRPLLIEHCYSCHSSSAKKIKGELRLDLKSAWMKGGSGGPIANATKPDESPLIQAVRRNNNEVPAMPPEKALGKDEVAVLVEWVKRGMPGPNDAPSPPAREPIEIARGRWPFTPLPKKIDIPKLRNGSWAANDVDRFILAKLESRNLTPSIDADKRTLIRRLTYDLIGLPPTPEEVAAFLADDSPTALERAVDRLLASQHYGERWGRHWLDVVRYADTAGDNSDFPIPQMYLYRNWVIDAVNRDLPFDQFVKEQLAGDLIGGKTEAERYQRIIATGYIATARRFGSRVDDYPQHLTIEDTIDNLGRAFLGLTVNCARCHDHKFDPLTMADYYGLYGIFHSTRYPWPGIELEQRQRDLVPLGDPGRYASLVNERDAEAKSLDKQIKAFEAEKKKNESDPKRRDAIQKEIEKVKNEQRQIANRAIPIPLAYAVAESKKVEDVRIQLKGDPTKPGATTQRRFPTVLGGQSIPSTERTSGRLSLANWIAAPDNPLFARVFVNRVWLHHFGRGIVPTPNDFGKQGAAPSHPELLDYLARSFIDGGWSLKKLHRLIVLSRTYRLASVGEISNSETADPNNDLLWKFRRQRLDAESIRDTLLMASGNLDRSMGAAHPFPAPSTWKFTQHNPFRAVYETNRRSVYLMTQRIQRHPFLAIFDGADPSASTGRRGSSTTALQSLYFLNDPFVHEQAAGLARRIMKDEAKDDGRIDRAYRILLSRPPTAEERRRAIEYLVQAAQLAGPKQAFESYVRSLFLLNEFVYIN